MAGIVLRNVNKVYPGGLAAVSNFSLEIPDKEFVALVGPPGCGKSTVLKLIAGSETPSEGDVFIDGVPVNEKPGKERNVAMVFQNYALYPHKTVCGNMRYALELNKLPNEEIERRIRRTARMLAIDHLLDRYPKALSAGQRQHVVLARAVVRNPAVFLFDEPLANLDAKQCAAARAGLTRLHRELDATFVYATHDPTEAMAVAQRIAVMSDGRILQADRPGSLYDRPGNLFVAGYIGTPQMNLLQGRLEKDEVGYSFMFNGAKLPLGSGFAGEELAPWCGRPLVLGIRPEHIHDGEAVIKAHPAQVIDAVAEPGELVGSEVYLHLNYMGSRLTARLSPGATLRAGDLARVCIDTAQAHLFDPASGRAVHNPKGSGKGTL